MYTLVNSPAAHTFDGTEFTHETSEGMTPPALRDLLTIPKTASDVAGVVGSIMGMGFFKGKMKCQTDSLAHENITEKEKSLKKAILCDIGMTSSFLVVGMAAFLREDNSDDVQLKNTLIAFIQSLINGVQVFFPPEDPKSKELIAFATKWMGIATSGVLFGDELIEQFEGDLGDMHKLIRQGGSSGLMLARVFENTKQGIFLSRQIAKASTVVLTIGYTLAAVKYSIEAGSVDWNLTSGAVGASWFMYCALTGKKLTELEKTTKMFFQSIPNSDESIKTYLDELVPITESLHNVHINTFKELLNNSETGHQYECDMYSDNDMLHKLLSVIPDKSVILKQFIMTAFMDCSVQEQKIIGFILFTSPDLLDFNYNEPIVIRSIIDFLLHKLTKKNNNITTRVNERLGAGIDTSITLDPHHEDDYINDLEVSIEEMRTMTAREDFDRRKKMNITSRDYYIIKDFTIDDPELTLKLKKISESSQAKLEKYADLNAQVKKAQDFLTDVEPLYDKFYEIREKYMDYNHVDMHDEEWGGDLTNEVNEFFYEDYITNEISSYLLTLTLSYLEHGEKYITMEQLTSLIEAEMELKLSEAHEMGIYKSDFLEYYNEAYYQEGKKNGTCF